MVWKKRQLSRGIPCRAGVFFGWMICFLGLSSCATAEGPTRSSEAVQKVFDDCCAKLTDKTIDAKEALRLLGSSDVVFIDARSPEEVAVSTISGSVSPQKFLEQPVQDKKVVVFCTIGMRSGKLTKSLQDKGVNAYNLRGGIYAWTYANGPLVNSKKQPTKKVHVYSKSWNYLRPDYEAVTR